jgi:hypothetical protein
MSRRPRENGSASLRLRTRRSDEQLLRSMLGDYDARHGGSLLETYDRVVAERSRAS